ncbi:MAG: DUF4476 domain-containing protein [Chitinophagia bacterium]|nr:DUF4476 domain-containing protein [Chitinophagia bacterium]
MILHTQKLVFMKRTFILFMLAIMPAFAFAQGCITIFSEDGDKFFLVLNGIKQNSVAQTNVRVDGLDNEYYNAKIVFEDGTKQPITKNVPTKDAGTSQFAEMTYKIKRTKEGQMKLRFYSATPIPVNYNPPPDMYYSHYTTVEQPAVTQVTQTTTVTQGGNGMNMSVGAGGVNMNVNVNDPSNGGGLNMNVNVGGVTNTQVTHTTTTTTTTTSGSTTPASQPARSGCSYPMDSRSFGTALKTIKDASFEETKLSTAKSIISGNCLNTSQVIEICKAFSFEESKLDFAKAAYSRTTDRNNYFNVNNVFSFDASKTELNEFISQQ